MSIYSPPTVAPSDPQAVLNELDRISTAMQEPNSMLLLSTTYAAPVKPRDGNIALADGTHWNPGSGAGYYGYRSGSWRYLG